MIRRPGLTLLAIALSLLFLPARGLAVQTTEDVGTLLVAHGAGEEWNARVHRLADSLQTGGPVEVSFLMGEEVATSRFQDAVGKLKAAGAERVVVVPVLASSHSGHYEQIRYLAGEIDDLDASMAHHLKKSGIRRSDAGLVIELTDAIDASMEMAVVLAERALALAGDPGSEALFLVGHGPSSAEDHALWMTNLRLVADSVTRLTGFRDVKLGLVRDDAPDAVRAEAVRSIRETIALQGELTGARVVVVPILVSKGYISTVKLPNDLEGLSIAYDGEGLLPHPQMARWVERRVREAVERPQSQPVAATEM